MVSPSTPQIYNLPLLLQCQNTLFELSKFLTYQLLLPDRCFSDPFSTFKLLPLGLHPPSTTGLGLGIPCIQSSVFFLINFYWQGCIFWNLPLCLEGRNPSPTFYLKLSPNWGLPRGLVVKNLPVNAGDVDLIPGLGRFPRGGQATHSSILAWEMPWTEEPGKATVHRVTKSWTQLSAWACAYTHTDTHT